MIRNIIFDWSGTLVDDLPAVWQATNYVLVQARSAKMTLDEFRAEFCLPFTLFYDKHTPRVPLQQLETWYHREFKQIQDSICELPHARPFLEFCRARKVRTFLLSTIHRDHFAVQAAATGLGKYLDKPYIEVRDKRKRIHEILEENRLVPNETLFVGDMQHDIETARHGGIHSCAVLTGYNTLNQLRMAKPDLIVEHLGELRVKLESNDMRLKPMSAQFEATHSPIATVGALIFNNAGKVLMVRTHKWSNLWGIPGGKIKWGESSLKALRREIKEETNLAIKDIEFVLVQDCIHSKEFYRDAHFILLNFTCRCVGSTRVKLNDEAREYRWVNTAQALKMPLNRPTRILLKAIKKPVIRAARKKRASMSRISIVDLEVFYCVGVTEEERAKPQRLLISVDMNYDFTSAAVSDRIEKTINYYDVVQDLLRYGDGRSWKLLEKMTANVAELILARYRPQDVSVEIKKFVIPQARYVSVSLMRSRP